jgi:hypothetical protein
MNVEHTVDCPRSRIGVWTVVLVAGIYVAWTGAWVFKGLLDRHTVWAATAGGGFAYRTAMKLLLWIGPSVWLIRLSGRKLRDVIRLARVRHAILWGGSVGLALALISLARKAMQQKPLFAASLGWPLFLGMHLPGWYFQDRLWQNLASPVGGALPILVLGLVFGLVGEKCRKGGQEKRPNGGHLRPEL